MQRNSASHQPAAARQAAPLGPAGRQRRDNISSRRVDSWDLEPPRTRGPGDDRRSRIPPLADLADGSSLCLAARAGPWAGLAGGGRVACGPVRSGPRCALALAPASHTQDGGRIPAARGPHGAGQRNPCHIGWMSDVSGATAARGHGGPLSLRGPTAPCGALRSPLRTGLVQPDQGPGLVGAAARQSCQRPCPWLAPLQRPVPQRPQRPQPHRPGLPGPTLGVRPDTIIPHRAAARPA